jgi:hypothetical protein
MGGPIGQLETLVQLTGDIGKLEGPPPMLNVLFIEWSPTELNVARRVGSLSTVCIFPTIAP